MAFFRAFIAMAGFQVHVFRGHSYRRNIITDISDPNSKFRDIVRRNVTESAHSVINKLSGQRRNGKSATSTKRATKQTSRGENKNTKNIKETSILKRLHSRRKHGSGRIVSSEFDIFAQKPVQTFVQETTEIIFRPIASVDLSDMEFFIPAENHTI